MTSESQPVPKMTLKKRVGGNLILVALVALVALMFVAGLLYSTVDWTFWIGGVAFVAGSIIVLVAWNMGRIDFKFPSITKKP